MGNSGSGLPQSKVLLLILNGVVMFYINFHWHCNQFEFLGGMDCLECGCCTFSCPAKISIVNNIRNAKKSLRNKSKNYLGVYNEHDNIYYDNNGKTSKEIKLNHNYMLR